MQNTITKVSYLPWLISQRIMTAFFSLSSSQTSYLSRYLRLPRSSEGHSRTTDCDTFLTRVTLTSSHAYTSPRPFFPLPLILTKRLIDCVRQCVAIKYNKWLATLLTYRCERQPPFFAQRRNKATPFSASCARRKLPKCDSRDRDAVWNTVGVFHVCIFRSAAGRNCGGSWARVLPPAHAVAKDAQQREIHEVSGDVIPINMVKGIGHLRDPRLNKVSLSLFHIPSSKHLFNTTEMIIIYTQGKYCSKDYKEIFVILEHTKLRAKLQCML